MVRPALAGKAQSRCYGLIRKFGDHGKGMEDCDSRGVNTASDVCAMYAVGEYGCF
jgi:hypothetical protein